MALLHCRLTVIWQLGSTLRNQHFAVMLLVSEHVIGKCYVLKCAERWRPKRKSTKSYIIYCAC